MKVIALHLPQFHEVPENNEWWGEGFTEWTNVRKAQPLYHNHYQPRIPLTENYYDLSDVNALIWQTKIAREYGISGFCFYHYWFNGKLMLEKPIEIYLRNQACDLPFCLCWANETWTNGWVSENNDVIMAQTYGNEQEWENHFTYLLPYFRDLRYIRIDDKPLFVIYKPQDIPNLTGMLDYYQQRANECGLKGIHFAYQHITYHRKQDDEGKKRFSFGIEYQPTFARNDYDKAGLVQETYLLGLYRTIVRKIMNKLTEGKVKKFSYDAMWRYVLKRKPENEKMIPGAFVDWDNTPRRHHRGTVFQGATPQKFYKYFSRQVQRARDVYHKDLLFIFAWNEWGEGGYLEPDEKYGFQYLEAIKKALIENNEFPI